MNGPGDLDLSADEYSALDPETALPVVRAYDLEEFLKLQLPPREHLVEPWFPQKGLALVHAWRGAGKTWFALDLGLAVATGRPFLKWPCPRARRVLYVDGEMPGCTLQKRIALLLAGATELPAPEYFKILPADLHKFGLGSLDDPAIQDVIISLARDVDLIIFDNLSTLVRGGVENEGESWLPVQEFLLRLRRLGKSVLAIHHQGKNREQRGTSRREDILDTVISLEQPDGQSSVTGARFKAVFKKSRGAFGPEIDSFVAVLEEAANGGVSWSIERPKGSDLKYVANLEREGLSLEAIGKKLGVSKSTAHRRVADARAKGFLNDE